MVKGSQYDYLYFILAISLSFGIAIPSSYADSTNMTKTYQVTCFENYYNVTFDVSNAIITNMTTTSNSNVTLSISNSSPTGKIIAYIPKNFLDFHLPSNIHFNPLAILNQNNIPISYADYSNSTHWIMNINIPNDVTKVKIEFPIPLGPGISTYSPRTCSVVPEFPFAIPILLISISSMIIFYRMKIRK